MSDGMGISATFALIMVVLHLQMIESDEGRCSSGESGS